MAAPASDWAHMIMSKAGSGMSMLDMLNEEQRAALLAWGAQQPGDPQRGGAVDLMAWPGWRDVAPRSQGPSDRAEAYRAIANPST